MTQNTHKMDRTEACWSIAGAFGVAVAMFVWLVAGASVIMGLAFGGFAALAGGLYLMWMLAPAGLGIGLQPVPVTVDRDGARRG
jgi:hypothetical protein